MTNIEAGKAVANKAAEVISGLIIVRWDEIIESWGDEPKFSISANITLRGEDGQTKVTTKVSFAKKVTDEIEAYVDNPGQELINFRG